MKNLVLKICIPTLLIVGCGGNNGKQIETESKIAGTVENSVEAITSNPDTVIPITSSGWLITHNNERVEFDQEGDYRLVIISSNLGTTDHSFCFEEKLGSGEKPPSPKCQDKPSGKYSYHIRRTNLLALRSGGIEAQLVDKYYSDSLKTHAMLTWTVGNYRFVMQVDKLF